MVKKVTKDRTRRHSTMKPESNKGQLQENERPIIKKGVLNPKVTKVVKGEIGTQADVYKYSGLDDIPDNPEKEDFDEEDDTRLAEV